jgi:hypothetical protein
MEDDKGADGGVRQPLEEEKKAQKKKQTCQTSRNPPDDAGLSSLDNRSVPKFLLSGMVAKAQPEKTLQHRFGRVPVQCGRQTSTAAHRHFQSAFLQQFI